MLKIILEHSGVEHTSGVVHSAVEHKSVEDCSRGADEPHDSRQAMVRTVPMLGVVHTLQHT